MNVILLLICMATLAFAEVHPGLKNAIDNGDYKTAKNLKEKMHVEGTYLPPSLSIKDAEFIYGPIINYKWLLDIDSYGCSRYSNNECSPEFIDKYLVKVCSGTTEYDVEVCLAWLNATPPTEWSRYANYFCKNQETISICSLYVEKQPLETQYEVLKELDEKKLLEFEKTTEIDTVVKEKLSKKQCLENWKQVYSSVKASIEYDSQLGTYRQHFSRGYLNESIICSFDGSRKKLQQCLGYLDEFSKGMKKECNSGKIEIDVQKKIQVKRLNKPFETVLKKMWEALLKTPWFAMDEYWIKRYLFVTKKVDTENECIKFLVNIYSSNAKISASNIKSACLAYPSIDKTISRDYGVEIFSCSKILSDYPAILGTRCEAKDSSWIKKIPVDLESRLGDKISLVCDKGEGVFRKISELEEKTGLLCDKTMNSWIKIYADQKDSGVVCDGKNGKLRKASEIEIYTKKICESAEKSWLDESKKFVCDKKLGKFRKATAVEKEAGLCTSDNQYKDTLSLYTCLNESWQRTKEVNVKNFKDYRDGQVYRAVKIGNQIWMAENLNFASEKSRCYDREGTKCSTYGRLYNWKTATTICPEGWHLPTKAEFEKLIAATGADEKAGVALKSISGWNDGDGTDQYGFNALPAGGYYDNLGPSGGGAETGFWSSTEEEHGKAIIMILLHDKDLAIPGSISKVYKFSVRCLKD